MRLPNDPALPADVQLMRSKLTTLFRAAAVAVNALLDKTDTPTEAASAVTVGASPYSHSDPVKDGLLVIRSGTVSLIEYGRNGAFTNLGITSGMVPVRAGDVVRITYTVAPTVTFIRQ